VKKIVLIILSMVFAAGLSMNAGASTECLVDSVSRETAILEFDPGCQTIAAVSQQAGSGSDPNEEPPPGIPKSFEENEGSRASKTGKIIMTLLLTTLVIIGLSIMPMLMISRAAKTRREQLKKDREKELDPVPEDGTAEPGDESE
jgi:hypothetical protein